MGSGSQNGDPGQIYPIFYRGSSGRTVPLYNINKGKREGNVMGGEERLGGESEQVGSRILQSGSFARRGRHHNCFGISRILQRFL